MSKNIQSWYFDYLGYHHLYSQYHQRHQSRSTRITGQTSGEISPLSGSPATRFLDFLDNPETLTLDELELHKLEGEKTRVVEFKVTNSASSWPVRFYPESKQYKFQTPENAENFKKAIFSEVSKSEEQQINNHLQNLLPFEIVDVIQDKITIDALEKVKMERRRNEKPEFVLTGEEFTYKQCKYTTSLFWVNEDGTAKIVLRVETEQNKIFDFKVNELTQENYAKLFNEKLTQCLATGKKSNIFEVFLSDLKEGKKPIKMSFVPLEYEYNVILKYKIPSSYSCPWIVRRYLPNGTFTFKTSKMDQPGNQKAWDLDNFTKNTYANKEKNEIKQKLEEFAPLQLIKWVWDGNSKKQAHDALLKGKFMETFEDYEEVIVGHKIEEYTPVLFKDHKISLINKNQSFDFDFDSLSHTKFKSYRLVYKQKYTEYLLHILKKSASDHLVRLFASKEAYDALKKGKFVNKLIGDNKQKVLVGDNTQTYQPFLAYREEKYVLGVYANNETIMEIDFTDAKNLGNLVDYQDLIHKKEKETLDWVNLWEIPEEKDSKTIEQTLDLMKNHKQSGITLILPPFRYETKKLDKECKVFAQSLNKIKDQNWNWLAILCERSFYYTYQVTEENGKKKLSVSIKEKKLINSLEVTTANVLLLDLTKYNVKLLSTASPSSSNILKVPTFRYNTILKDEYIYDWAKGEKDASKLLQFMKSAMLDELDFWQLENKTTKEDLPKVLQKLQTKSGISLIISKYLSEYYDETALELLKKQFTDVVKEINNHKWSCIAIINPGFLSGITFKIDQTRNVLSIVDGDKELEKLNLPTENVLILDGDEEQITLFDVSASQETSQSKLAIEANAYNELLKNQYIFNWKTGEKNFERLISLTDSIE